jgi:hypothetical protein
MPKDWKEISTEEILNFDGSQTAIMARYERIMQQRSIDAVISLRDKVTGLMETIYRASQGIQEKTDKLLELYDRISRFQGRQQVVLIALSVVVALSTATYTWITWESVAAMREGNEIQRQLLELQKSSSAATPAPKLTVERGTRKNGARLSP